MENNLKYFFSYEDLWLDVILVKVLKNQSTNQSILPKHGHYFMVILWQVL